MSARKLSQGIYLLPLFLILLYYSGTMNFVYIFRGDEPTQLRRLCFFPAYLISFTIFLFRPHIYILFTIRAYPYVLFTIFVSLSLLWSSFPEKVLINFVHSIGMLFVILTAMYKINTIDLVLRYMLYIAFLGLIASLTFILLFPNYGIEIGLNNRWHGLFPHPNTLGTYCWICIWLCFSIHIKKVGNVSWLLTTVIILASIFVIKANSITSIICAISTCSIFLFNFFFKGNVPKKIVYLLAFFWLITFLMLSALIVDNSLLTLEGFFTFLGRDLTFTGRSNLWDAGIKAAMAKLAFGWSFDSQQSILSNQIIQYGQFHNGYINLFVAGGLSGLLFFGILLISFIHSIVKLDDFDTDKPIIFTFVLVFLMHNITEASIMVFTHYLWVVFLFLFTYLIIRKSESIT